MTQLGEVMLSMASNMMLVDERVLWMAQREAMACSRIVSCLRKIAGYRLAAAQAFSLVSPRHLAPCAACHLSFLLTLPLSLLPTLDIPQHRTGGPHRQGCRLERHDLHVVPKAEPRAHARPGPPAHLQVQHHQLIPQHPCQGELSPHQTF